MAARKKPRSKKSKPTAAEIEAQRLEAERFRRILDDSWDTVMRKQRREQGWSEAEHAKAVRHREGCRRAMTPARIKKTKAKLKAHWAKPGVREKHSEAMRKHAAALKARRAKEARDEKHLEKSIAAARAAELAHETNRPGPRQPEPPPTPTTTSGASGTRRPTSASTARRSGSTAAAGSSTAWTSRLFTRSSTQEPRRSRSTSGRP